MKRKTTWEMTAVELAKTVAEQYGIRGACGGWIYDPAGRAICKGWDAFATMLRQKRFIRVGVGINWTLIAWAGGPTRSPHRALQLLSK